MTDTVTVRGYIATAPVQKYLPKTNVPVANFRLASTPRWFDNATGQWRTSDTNWYTVNSFRALAHNSARSLQVGQPILVTGRLKVKQFERSDGSQGTSIEIDASSIGHDLNYGLARFERISDRRPEMEQAEREPFDTASAQTQQLPYQPPQQVTQPEVSPGYQLPTAGSAGSQVPGEAPNLGLTEVGEKDEAVMAMTS